MRKILATTAACFALFAQTSAEAANGCYGCNVMDEGVLNSSLVGAAIYYNGTRGIADRIDTSDNTVYLRLSDGRSGWASARSVYTRASYDERQTATGAAVTVGFLALLAAAVASSGSSSSASSSSSSQGNYQPQYRSRAPDTPSYGNSSAPSPRTTPGFYGDCHGGAAYGCN